MKRSVLIASGLVVALCATTTASSAETTLPTVDVTLTGTAIAVGGDLQSGAVNIAMTSTAKDAEPTLVHLKPGVTADQVLAALRSGKVRDPNDAMPYGEIVFDASTPKGRRTIQTMLPAGDYLALETHGSNPARFPHSTFSVAQAAQPAALAKPKATIHAIDFAFRGPRTLHRGAVVRFQNDGYVVHMITAIRVRNARDARKLSAALKAGKDNGARRLAIGAADFLGPVSHGGLDQMTITAKAGTYVLACFMDTQDHREHTRIGMTRTIRIAK